MAAGREGTGLGSSGLSRKPEETSKEAAKVAVDSEASCDCDYGYYCYHVFVYLLYICLLALFH